jgi:pilus assembly protein CpaE
VITMLRQRFPHIVLDLSHDFHELALAGLDLADEILLLFTPELPALLNTSATLEAFESLGYPRERVRLILNHVSGQQDWTLPEMARTLKRRIAAVIPFAPDLAAAAIAEGIPLVLAKPTDEIGITLEDLSFTISARECREQEPAQPSPAWMRISSRQLQSSPGDSWPVRKSSGA